MEIRLLKKSEKGLWDAFIDGHNTSFYDTEIWESAILKTFPGFIIHKIVLIDDGKIAAGISLFETESFRSGHKLSNAVFKFPSSIFIFSERHFDLFADFLLIFARENLIDMIELLPPAGAFHASLHKYGFQARCCHAFTLLCRGTHEETFARYKDRFRTKLRKLERETGENADYQFSVLDDQGDLRAFYDLLVTENRKKHLNIPPPFALIVTLWKKSAPLNSVRIYALKHRSKIVAADMIFFHKNKAYYGYVASNLDFAHKNVSTYLLGRIIRSFYREEKVTDVLELNFEDPANKGLCLFKSRWGTQVSKQVIYTLGLRNKNDIAVRALAKSPMRSMLKYMPSSIIRKLADHLYEHLA